MATETHCPYCSLQCGMALSETRTGPSVQPTDFPTNRGGMCAKGWTSVDLLHHPDRLLTPLVRKVPGDRTSDFRPAGWDEALDLIVTAIRTAQETSGPDSVGCFGGGGLTNEKAYLLGKFARVGLRTASIDYNGRFCMSSAATAGNRAFGIDRGLPFPLEDVGRTEALLLVGANPADTMPPAMQYLDESRAAGGRHIVVDPRRTATAKGAHLHLQPLPGTDLALANGMLHIAIREGLVDEDYIAARTTGFGAVRAGVAGYWPDRVERITGVPEAAIREAVRILGAASAAMILTARGAEQHSSGTDTAQAYVNLALALGLPGRPASGYGTITGQGNGQGGREHGQKADQLPGYRKLDDPAARAHVAGVWGVDPDELPRPGLSAYEMLDRLGTPDGVKVLLVFASNIAVSAPRRDHVVERLRSLDLLVVSDIFLSETAAEADVVLPTAQWAEEEGTMTNLEGRVIRRRASRKPPGDVHDDLWIINRLAGGLGRQSLFATDDAETVFAELRRASAGGIADYAGITYDRIDAEQGVFWPCPDVTHPGTPRLFAESFPTPDGRARFVRTEYRDPAELPDRDYPHVLTTGRVMQHYQSGSQTRRVAALRMSQPDARVELHPDLARRYGVGDGDMVRLRTRRGSAVFRARITDTIRPDTLFTPFHWGGASAANALTNPALDRHSRMPAFKVCAVAIERDDAEARPRDDAPSHRTPSHQEEPIVHTPRFLQGVFPFEGKGLDRPFPVDAALSYVVPDGVQAQAVYLRAGNSSPELVCLVLMRDGQPMRYFPVGARGDVHVPLRVVEDLDSGSTVEVHLAAPAGVAGSVVVDLGLVEI